MKLIIVVNGVSSPQKLIDAAKVVYSFEHDLVSAFVITKPTGMAAQVGIPEVGKLAYKLGKTLVILPSLNDAIDLFKPNAVYLIYKSDTSIPLEEVEISEKTMIVISGSDGSFSKNELAVGRCVYPRNFIQNLNPAAELALALYILSSKKPKYYKET